MTGPFGTTAGEWRWVDNAMSNGKPDTWGNSGLSALVSDERLVCWFGDSSQYYPTEGEEPSPADKRAIAQVPAMLALVQAVRSHYTPHSELVEMASAIISELEGK